METMTTTENARAVLQDLEMKLAAAKSRHDETHSEASAIAFAAHTGDADARKKLDKLNADAAKHGSEIMSLEAAIVEARRRVREAEAAEADDVARDKAEVRWRCLVTLPNAEPNSTRRSPISSRYTMSLRATSGSLTL
jgi:septal ring factor EnvC (AmiA/AmiB activator)